MLRPPLPRFLTFCITLLILYSPLHLKAQDSTRPLEGSDKGHLFLGPRMEIASKKIKKDQRIQAYTRKGLIVTENTGSPWHQATCFAHGSVIKDADGKILHEVVITEAADVEGDLTWGVWWYPEGNQQNGSFEMIQGTGKWAGISGRGRSEGWVAKRADEHQMPLYRIQWEIDPENPPFSDSIEGKEKYKHMDKCLSFHGPHVFLESSKLSNGISLEFSSQSGVLMSMLSPETLSPRNGATCFDRGTTVKLNGKTQGDIMLLEDTDADGDVAWLYHIWWYNKGPGIYQFIGGTGKWEGIQGVGVTRGMYKGRSDDHFMLKSELHWNLPE